MAVFSITRVQTYAKDAFPTAEVYGPAPDPELRLITCGGTFDPTTGHYLSNVVPYRHPGPVAATVARRFAPVGVPSLIGGRRVMCRRMRPA